MRLAPRLASLILLSYSALNMPVRAAEVQVGSALICDTRQEAERFAAVYDGDSEKAVSAVNTEVHDESACAMASVAYLLSAPLTTARTKDATFQIVRILVLAVITEHGVQTVKPAEFFSALAVDERDA
jgi:hypothetical protein